VTPPKEVYMKDVFGKELNVGDRVAFAKIRGYRADMIVGRITKLHPKTFNVETEADTYWVLGGDGRDVRCLTPGRAVKL
jgi:hypothetical protein